MPLAALAPLAAAASSLERDDLLFYASLDGRLTADFARGAAEPQGTVPALEFAAGVRGKGVVARERVTWDGAANVRGEQGTLAFWLRPVDWSTGDGRNHHLAWLDTANGVMRLYQYYPGNLGMHLQSPQGTRVCWANARLSPERFVHLAFAWRHGEWTFYVDGVRRQRVTENWMPFGDIRRLQLGEGNTVFDELMLFGRALRAEEVQALLHRALRAPGAE